MLFVLDSAINLEQKTSSLNYHCNFNLKIEYPPSYLREVWHCCKTRFNLTNKETENFYWNDLFVVIILTIISTYLIGKNWTLSRFPNVLYKYAYPTQL